MDFLGTLTAGVYYVQIYLPDVFLFKVFLGLLATMFIVRGGIFVWNNTVGQLPGMGG